MIKKKLKISRVDDCKMDVIRRKKEKNETIEMNEKLVTAETIRVTQTIISLPTHKHTHTHTHTILG